MGQVQLLGKLIIKATLTVETGLHIGGSNDYAPIGAVDSVFVRYDDAPAHHSRKLGEGKDAYPARKSKEWTADAGSTG